MPIYISECPHCGARHDYFAHIDQRDDSPECCGAKTERIIMPTAIRADIPAYQSPIDGRPINSRVQRREDLKRNGCREWEGLKAEQEQAASFRQSAEAAFDRKIEQGIGETLGHISSASQKVLKQALQ